MCLNFEDTCALNSPIFLSVVKKSLDYFYKLVISVKIDLTVQTADVLVREVSLATH